MALRARLVALPAALTTLLALAASGAAPAGAAEPPPTVSSVKPLSAQVGQTVRIRGRHFERGRGKTTVIFKRDGGRPVFVKADLATGKMLEVTLPARLGAALKVRGGVAVSTRLRIRVLTTRASRAFTTARRSPVVHPFAPPDADCDGDGIRNGADADDDDDLLADTLEATLRTNACAVDSDGDGAEDGYEYRSARDLNDDEYQSPNTFLPHPGKRPYPNPLFADAAVDYDGDGLALGEEHALWRFTIGRGARRALDALTYSDGEQYSVLSRGADGRRRPVLAAAGYERHQAFLAGAAATGHLRVHPAMAPSWWEAGTQHDLRDANLDATVSTAELLYYDLDGDGLLSDDERDEDGDGLTNYHESHGPTSAPSWWAGCYAAEGAYPVAFAGTNLDDPDTDGDGVLDGADDQDHDDLPNLMELSRYAAAAPWRAQQGSCDPGEAEPDPAPAKGRVNPFNPCLPWAGSRTCQRHPSFSTGYAPFTAKDADINYWVLN